MRKREPKAGDYYLLPFTGKQRDLLVQAVEPAPGGHWRCSYPAHPTRRTTSVLLSSCHTCSPARAQRILGVNAVEAPSTEFTGVRCMCVVTGCKAGPGCPRYTEHCRKHIAHTRGMLGMGESQEKNHG